MRYLLDTCAISEFVAKRPNQRVIDEQEWMVGELFVRFSDRILPIDLDVILVWGQMIGHLELRGKKMAAMDSLIAAIALCGNLHRGPAHSNAKIGRKRPLRYIVCASQAAWV